VEQEDISPISGSTAVTGNTDRTFSASLLRIVGLGVLTQPAILLALAVGRLTWCRLRLDRDGRPVLSRPAALAAGIALPGAARTISGPSVAALPVCRPVLLNSGICTASASASAAIAPTLAIACEVPATPAIVTPPAAPSFPVTAVVIAPAVTLTAAIKYVEGIAGIVETIIPAVGAIIIVVENAAEAITATRDIAGIVAFSVEIPEFVVTIIGISIAILVAGIARAVTIIDSAAGKRCRKDRRKAEISYLMIFHVRPSPMQAQA
jgi:hypothetical protein